MSSGPFSGRLYDTILLDVWLSCIIHLYVVVVDQKQVQGQAAIRSHRMITAKCTSPSEKQESILCDPRIPGSRKTALLLRPCGSLGPNRSKLQPAGLPSAHALRWGHGSGSSPCLSLFSSSPSSPFSSSFISFLLSFS